MLLIFPQRTKSLLVVAEEDLDGQPAVSADLEAVGDGVDGLGLVISQLPAVEVKVGLNARGSDTLGDDAPALLDTPLEENLLDSLALGLGNLGEGLVLVERRVSGTQAGVASAVDALGGVVGDELGRGVARVQLDLVGGRGDLGVGVAQQLLEVLDAKVGHTNVADLARADELLHLAPGVGEVPVLVVLLLAGDGGAGPVHEVQVDVVGAELGQAVSDGLGDTLVVGVVELGGQPDLVAGNARGLDALAYFFLVAVGGGSVNVTVAGLEGGLNGGTDLSGLGLPCSETDGGDLVAGVEGKCATGKSMTMLAIAADGVDCGESQDRTIL